MFPFLHYTFAICCKKSTRSPLGATAKTLRLACAAHIVWSILAGSAWSQIYETFDTPRPKFRLWNSDAKAQVIPIQKTEPGVESMEVSFENGSYVHLIYPIEPSAPLDYLKASVRIRSAQGGLKIGFRVVFPRSTDPATHDSLVEVIYGTPTEGAGRWSTTAIENVASLFEARQRYLRARHGPSVNLDDAYIDAVVLNVYAWPSGTIRMQIDDLQVEGMIAPSVTERYSEPDTDGVADVAQLSIQDQMLRLQATVPRWIQYQGESLDYLQSLGFTGIITSRPEDPLVIEQAARTKMGVIATPPELVPTDNLATNFQHIQGWLLGLELDQSRMDQTRARVSRLTRFPQSLHRPMIGVAMEMYGSYGRLSDWLAVPYPLPTRVRSAREASEIMQSDLRPLVGRSLPLTSLVTQMPNEWAVQKAMAVRALGSEPADMADYDLLQVRLQVYRSMMQGTRGWIFRSGRPLDSGDLTSLTRSQGYRGVTREIELFMPWIRSGQSNWKPISTDSKQHTAAILDTPNSQLCIIVASGNMDQICSVAPPNEKIQVTIPVSGQQRNIFRITHGELEVVRPQPTPNGLVITIERPALIEQIVTVVDPKPVAYLREQLAMNASSMIDSRLEITQQVLDTAQRTLIAQKIPASAPEWEDINLARSFQSQSMQYLSRNNIPLAAKTTDQALVVAQGIVRKSWEEAAGQFSSFQSSPLIASPLSMPLHFEFNRMLQGRTWQSLVFPSTPFRSTDEFYQSAWQVDRRLTDTVQSDCLIGSQGPDGQPCLLLSARPVGDHPIASGYAGAAMRVTSPPIIAPVGAMLQIGGLVRIESRPGETQSGLLISDDLGGESLGQLISSVDATQYAWRRFVLFRFVTQSEGVRLHFETRGEMSAAISDLTAEYIIPSQAPGLLTRPINAEDLEASGLNRGLPIRVPAQRSGP